MFTGIIETRGIVMEITAVGPNKIFWLKSAIAPELQVDQSLNHDGVCMTIEDTRGQDYRITAVEETLKKTTLKLWEPGREVNLERAIRLADRLDGHLVQGHVDTTGVCLKRKEKAGMPEFVFGYPGRFSKFIIEKGSICVNGVSLTAYDVKKKSFRVAIVPYTFENSNLKHLQEDELVNLEFDLVGKYLLKKAPKL